VNDIADPSQPRTTLERQAKSLEDSGQKAAAGWVGDPRVREVIGEMRPDFQLAADRLGLDEGLVIAGALRILGGSFARAQGDRLIEEPNPFADWPQERLALAGMIAAVLRLSIADVAERLQHDGVSLDPVRHIAPDQAAPDGLLFSADHFYLLLLLWGDIPLEGRSGAEIAADLQALPTGSFERTGDASHTSDHANERDVRGLFSARAAWRSQQGQESLRKPYSGGRPRRRAEWQRRAIAAIEVLLREDPGLHAVDLHRVWGGNEPVAQFKRGRPGTELWCRFERLARTLDPPAERWDGWSGEGAGPEAPHPTLATVEAYFRDARRAISG
jgi:hypothetical protein